MKLAELRSRGGAPVDYQSLAFDYQRSPDQDAGAPVRRPVVVVGAGPVGLSLAIDLAQRESMNVSAGFAALLKREGSAYFPFRPEYHRFASLVVLKAPDVPSILFETGYVTNPVDLAYIQSAEGRKRIAEGMRSAIEAHFARRLVQLAAR